MNILIASLIFAIVATLLKLAILLVSRLFDCAIDVENPLKPSFVENIPDGVSPHVYHSRHLLDPKYGPIENQTLTMIELGFEADDVFRLVQYVKDGTVDTQTQEEEHVPSETILRINEKEYTIPISRMVLDRIFTTQFPWYALILIFIFTFALSALYMYSRTIFSPGARWLVSFYLTLATYSMYLTPIVDPYSLTVSDPGVAYTRPLFFTIIGLFYLFPDFEPTFLVYLFPVWQMLNVLSHPVVFIKWVLEWMNRYIFGGDGISGSWQLFFDLVRNFVVMFIVANLIPVIGIRYTYGITFVLLVIPTHLHLYNWQTLFHFLLDAVLFVAVALWVPLGEITEWVTFGLLILVFVVLPYISSNQRYVVFHARLFPFPIRYPRFVAEAIVAPLYLFVVFDHWEDDAMLAAIIIVHYINRSLGAAHIIPFAAFVYRVVFRYEMAFDCTFFFALVVTEKLFRIFDRVRLWSKWSVLWVPNPSYPWLDAVIRWVDARIFTPSRVLRTPSFVWSLITGSSMMLVGGQESLSWFSGFRGTAIWRLHEEESELEYPYETPIYKSVSKWIENNFASLVNDGRLGLVNGGDIFIFFSETLNMIVQVLEVGAGYVSVQMRGLEYSSQMSCHQSELTFLANLRDSYGSLECTGQLSLTYYDIRALSIKITALGASKVDLENAFLGLEAAEISNWFFTAVAWLVSNGTEYEPVEHELTDDQRVIVETLQADPGQTYGGFQEISEVFTANGGIEQIYLMNHFTDERIRIGTMLSFMASAGLAPGLDECKDFVQEVLAHNIELIEMKGGPMVVKYAEEDFDMTILKISKELVRGLWLNEGFTQLFLLMQLPERSSIQKSTSMLRNMVNQACDHPFGYPAYTSKVIGSTIDVF